LVDGRPTEPQRPFPLVFSLIDEESDSFSKHKAEKRQKRLLEERQKDWEGFQRDLDISKAPPLVTPAEMFFMDDKAIIKVNHVFNILSFEPTACTALGLGTIEDAV
jgi:hypothetical protein